MLCTPKLFSSVKKNVSPEGPPIGVTPLLLLLRDPGDGEREVSDDGRDLGRAPDVAAVVVPGPEDDGGGEAEEAKTSSKGRMAVVFVARQTHRY